MLVTIYSDRTFTFILKTPPASELLKRAAGIVKGSPEPNRNKVAKLSHKQVAEIAKLKMPDLNTTNLGFGDPVDHGNGPQYGHRSRRNKGTTRWAAAQK